MWYKFAIIIITVNPAAANVVSCGRILSAAGRISLIAPSNSEIPMNRTNSSGSRGAQKIVGAIS